MTSNTSTSTSNNNPCLFLNARKKLVYFFDPKRKASAKLNLDLQYSCPSPLLSSLGHDSYNNQDLKEPVISSNWHLNITNRFDATEQWVYGRSVGYVLPPDPQYKTPHWLCVEHPSADCWHAVAPQWFHSGRNSRNLSLTTEFRRPCRSCSWTAGSSETVQRLLGIFLSVLFVLFWDYTWEKERV